MGNRISAYLRQHHLALLCLFLLLSGGTAYATHPGGANTISSEDIINGEVQTPDLDGAAVTGTRLAGNSVNSSKVVNSSLTTNDVLNDSLTGDDVLESSLEGVDADRVAGGVVCRTPEVTGFNPSVTFIGNLCESGPLHIRPVCTEVEEGIIRADLNLFTTANDAFYGATSTDPDFEVADSPAPLLSVQDKAATPESAVVTHDVVAGINQSPGADGQIAGVAAVRVDAADPDSPCEFVLYGAG